MNYDNNNIEQEKIVRTIMNKLFLKSITIIMLLTGLIIFCGCGNKTKTINSINDLMGSKVVIAYPIGSATMFEAQKFFPDAKLVSLGDDTSSILGLQKGRADAFCHLRHNLEFYCNSHPDINCKILKEYFGKPNLVAFGISRKSEIENLKEKADEFIQLCHKNGIIDQLLHKWLYDMNAKPEDIELPKDSPITLRVATNGEIQPYSFFLGNELVGFDIDLAKLFAKHIGAKIEFQCLDFTAIVMATGTGKADIISSNLMITEERKQTIDFSEAIFVSENALLVRKDDSSNQKKADNNTKKTKKFDKIEDFYNARIGQTAGASTGLSIKECYPKIPEFIDLNGGIADGIIMLKNNKLDAYANDYPLIAAAVSKNPELAISPVRGVPENFGIGLVKGSELTPKIEKIISEFKKDGTLTRLNDIWLGNDEKLKIIPEQNWPQKNGILKVAVDNAYPMVYISNNNLVGHDVNLAVLIGKALGMKVEFILGGNDARITALQSSKADIVVSSLSITEERKQAIDMIPYYDSTPVFMVRKADLLGEDADYDKDENQVSFWEDLKASFNRTFIVEDRWKLITDGLGVTIFISICSGILGSIIGFCLCMLRRTKNKVIDWLTLSFIRIIQGIPAVVFLMVLYYVVFGKVDISPIAVSIIGFAINFGAYVSEMMRTGIEAVDVGQNEAALALGYSNVQSFFKVIFPQAAKHFLPVMKGEFIGMVKMTSIVGYIAGQDLTKATDIIRARTMEAFFPLIVTAVIYFIIANLMTTFLSKIETMLNPRK